jgi:hypothetical protein
MPIVEDVIEGEQGDMNYKPVIYLYPEESMDISVQLNFEKRIFTTIYPKFNGKNTWNVHAKPNGDILIKDKTYPYLFWEAESYNPQETNEGFIVTEENAEKFLEEKLDILGLNEKEKTDFITYWLPVLLRNKLSLCSFQSKKFFNNIELNVTPKPDSMIRVFLTIKKLERPINIREQKLKSAGIKYIISALDNDKSGSPVMGHLLNHQAWNSQYFPHAAFMPSELKQQANPWKR